MQKNALRLFDCKNSNCQTLLDNNAPLIFDSISNDDNAHFNELTSILNQMEIPYIHDHKLVRGLDYYSHTTFEIISTVLGGQDALCGGGRYNNLVKQLGGKSTPAVGFAAGVERLILAIENQIKINDVINIYLIHLGKNTTPLATKIANDLRQHCGLIVIFETLRRSLKSQMREAGRCGAQNALILGEDELLNNEIIVKDMNTSNQEIIKISKIVTYFNNQKK